MKFKVSIFITVLFLLSCYCIAQQIFVFGDTVRGCYTNLGEALKEPKKVKCLDLRSKGLKEIPIDIFKFINLEYLDLSSTYIKDTVTYKNDSVHYNSNKYRSVDSYTPTITYNPNMIKSIPNEVLKLKKLKYINLVDTQILEKRVEELRKLMPNCVIDSDGL